MKATQYQNTGVRCDCRPGVERDNCPNCEGTGWVIDFCAIRARKTQPAHSPEPWRVLEGNESHVRALDGSFIADCDCGIEWLKSRCVGNATRIVACVNACAGIANPEAVPAVVEALKNLEDAATLIEERWEHGDLADAVRSLMVDRDAARSALAALKGVRS